jgi:hypothetical protein
MSAALDLIEELPAAPSPKDDDLLAIQDRREWTALFFEWHKVVAEAALLFSFMQKDSSAVKRINDLKYLLLTALINRCSRLMMANLRTASEDRHDEAVSIVNRSIKESAIKVIWLCETQDKDRFSRVLADGLKGDLELKSHIQNNIKARGHKIAIEDRMLKSIQRSLKTARLSDSSIKKTRRLPSLQSLMLQIGMSDLSYVVIQRMGSHMVHGTWTALLAHNIEVEDGVLKLNPDFNSPHPNGLVFSSLFVLEALLAFTRFVIRNSDQPAALRALEEYKSKLLSHNSIMARNDKSRVD